MKKYILFILLLLLTTLVVGCTQPQEPAIKEYTLTFLGLNDEVIETKKLPAGSVFDYPDFPEYEGHDFLFWDSEETILNSDLTIRAIYDAHTFQVKFYDKDKHKVNEQTIKFGESATAPTLPTVENFEFVGWDKKLKDFLLLNSFSSKKKSIVLITTIKSFYSEKFNSAFQLNTMNNFLIVDEAHNFINKIYDKKFFYKFLSIILLIITS